MAKRQTVGQRSGAAVATWREVVFARDVVSCVAAGILEASAWPCWGIRTIQHRIGRGAGGSALFDSPAHLLTMCAHHNAIAESDADFAAICRESGWTLPRLRVAVDPVLIPVRYFDGWHELDDNGFRTPVWGPHAVERVAEFWRQPQVDAGSIGGTHRA